MTESVRQPDPASESVVDEAVEEAVEEATGSQPPAPHGLVSEDGSIETIETIDSHDVDPKPGIGPDSVADSASAAESDPAADAKPSDEVDASDEGDQPVAAGLDFADFDQLDAALEAILFIVESPVSVDQLASVVQQPSAEVEQSLDRLARRYEGPAAGIELRRIADGVRIYTRPELTKVVEAFLLEGQRTKLSNAALETLAVIAYRQPVTRGRISAIRGVNVDGVIRTLVTRGLIVEDGTDPESGAGLFRTTALFLEKMGLQTLEELPSLAPLLPDIDSLETDELSG